MGILKRAGSGYGGGVSESPKYAGLPIKFVSALDTDGLYDSAAKKDPKFYFINPACARRMMRTGRGMIEWLWNDDMDTRKPDEIA